MDNGTLSSSDVALLTRSNDGFGNGWGGMIWLFAILALMGGGFGGWGNSAAANAIGYENLATSNEVQRGFDAQNSAANEREILSAVNAGTAQAVAATNETFHNTVQYVGDKYSEIQRDLGSLAVGQANNTGNSQRCCCEVKQLVQGTASETQKQIAQNDYNAAMRDAATNANLTQQIQSIKDMLNQNKIEALQAQVGQLQLAQATNGMLKFPTSWSYGAGPFPPIYGGCCGGSSI